MEIYILVIIYAFLILETASNVFSPSKSALAPEENTSRAKAELSSRYLVCKGV